MSTIMVRVMEDNRLLQQLMQGTRLLVFTKQQHQGLAFKSIKGIYGVLLAFAHRCFRCSGLTNNLPNTPWLLTCEHMFMQVSLFRNVFP